MGKLEREYHTESFKSMDEMSEFLTVNKIAPSYIASIFASDGLFYLLYWSVSIVKIEK